MTVKSKRIILFLLISLVLVFSVGKMEDMPI